MLLFLHLLRSECHEGWVLFNGAECVVINNLLLHAPLLECLVEAVERQRSLAFLEMLVHLKVLLELTIEGEELIKSLNIAVGELEGE